MKKSKFIRELFNNKCMQFKKARLKKWITMIVFALAIVLLILLSKNKGSFSGAWSDFTGFLR